jgi:hypothetical protein
MNKAPRPCCQELQDAFGKRRYEHTESTKMDTNIGSSSHWIPTSISSVIGRSSYISHLSLTTTMISLLFRVKEVWNLPAVTTCMWQSWIKDQIGKGPCGAHPDLYTWLLLYHCLYQGLVKTLTFRWIRILLGKKCGHESGKSQSIFFGFQRRPL